MADPEDEEDLSSRVNEESSTMQKNLDGENVDSRGVSVESREKSRRLDDGKLPVKVSSDELKQGLENLKSQRKGSDS